MKRISSHKEAHSSETPEVLASNEGGIKVDKKGRHIKKPDVPAPEAQQP